MKRSQRRWSELSRGQRTGVLAASVIQLSLQVAALVDLRRRPPGQVKGAKAAWVAASFVNFLGPVAYFIFGRTR